MAKRGRPSKAQSLKKLTDLSPSEDLDHDRSDAQLLSDIQDRYNMMTKLGQGAVKGNVRGVVVSGAPGVGKTYELERILQHKAEKSRQFHFEHLKGTISPINLYKKLYDYGSPGSVLLIDDADDVFFDATSLNLLKAALDSSSVRNIGWHTESSALKEGGEQVYPTSFEYQGSIVFITNICFQSVIDEGKQKKIVPHLNALMSRSLYLDLKIHSLRALSVWVDYLVNSKNILVREFGLTKTQQRAATNWMKENATGMRTFSIRDSLKIGQMMKSDPQDWESAAEMLLLR
tara:strand:+ start:3177 stop:4043 length:867 start_codon:yes stop_codon:yes gene_type:complete